MESGIEEAIRLAGGQAELARIMGCTQQNVSVWKNQGFAPTERVVEIEQATGVGREKLINPKCAQLLLEPDQLPAANEE